MPTPTATIFLPYSALDDVLLRGTRAAQPAASAVTPGTLYGVTDEGPKVERSNGTAWEAYSPAPAAPLAHHATHETGGSDAIAALSGAVITSGTLPDARLSANVAMRTVANAFADNQRIDNGKSLFLNESAAPANGRLWQIVPFGQLLYLQPVSDDLSTASGNVTIARDGTLRSTGALYEQGRMTPLGYWTSYTPSLTANAGTATVTNNLSYKYALLGKTLLVSFYLDVTLSATPTSVTLNLPAGLTAAGGYASGGTFAAVLTSTSAVFTGMAQLALGVVNLIREPLGGLSWPSGAQRIGGLIAIELT